MKFFGTLVSKSSTSTLSNVGVIDIDNKYKKYIDNILVSVTPGKVQKIKCTICLFDKNLNVTINSNIDDAVFEQEFLKLLNSQINSIKVKSNSKNEI